VTERGSLLTVREVAGRSRFSTKTVRRAIDRGELLASKVSGRWLVWESDFLAWIDRGRFVPRPVPDVAAIPAPPERGSLAALREIEAQS
jgi:excisionase family DNA binding protein